jgi:hypothetical protein
MSFPGIDCLLMVEKSGFASSVRVIDRGNLSDLRLAFRHLGISMTDVLGTDRIIWVEGATEELVFPDVARRAGIELDESVKFTAVAATGDFNRRGSSKKAVIRLYTEATKAVAPLVQGSSFLLDRETLPDTAVEQVTRETDGRLIMLERRCLESYALNPQAIASLLQTEISGLEITEQSVADEISALGGQREYGATSKWKKDLRDAEWLKRVDAAKLLSQVFETLTDARLEFKKTMHTPRLIADTPLEHLFSLVQQIEASLKTAGWPGKE